VNSENTENEERISTELSGEAHANADPFPSPDPRPPWETGRNSINGKCAHRKPSHPRGADGKLGNNLRTNIDEDHEKPRKRL